MRYIIGIDLGTTNCCVSYVDTESDNSAILPFRIPQIAKEGQVEALPTLPSFCYLASQNEWPSGSLNLPWRKNPDFFVGSFALSQGAKVPTKLVQSAKSWMCHPAANRRDKILPVEAADESMRVSPVEATSRYLSHIKEAWNDVVGKGNPDDDFENQEIILTVPASFDEIARTLTVEAAKLAGFRKMTLLEEPQAAFYSWISQNEAVWENQLKEGDCILVCDVGGGTTDFSLIDVVSKKEQLTFQRMAVGDHLLLGGDNMDASLAHYLESKLSAKHEKEFNALQWLQLKHEARKAKESLLDEKKSSGTYRVVLQGSGSGVVASTIAVEIDQQEVRQLLLDGFFGQYAWNDALALRKTVGLRAMGLPYEDDPSMTKQLAAFLRGASGQEIKKPDYVLFNGGTMKPKIFQEAIVHSLSLWFPDKIPKILSSYHLDLAVARGAAYYGKVRRGLGVKIGGGMARSYYLVCDVKEGSTISKKALTLLSRGAEEGSVYEPDHSFWLMPNTPVSFQLCSSHVRLNDQPGELVEIDPQEMQMLPPMHTVLRFGKKQLGESVQEKIPVHLQIGVTPIGTLEMLLKSQKTEHSWALDFQLRTASGQDDSLATIEKGRVDQTFQEGYLKEGEDILLKFFNGEKAFKPEKIMEKLEEALALPRQEWPPSLMRKLSEIVLKEAPKRKISELHEARWWNLIGFLLRPGFGYPLDDFRLKELWKIILSDFKAVKSVDVQIQLWICYRRIAGGLNKGQQSQLASELLSSLNDKRSRKEETKADYRYSEKLRAIASMELLENSTKVKLGNALMTRIVKGEAVSADFWALGRLGARQLLYGSIANVVSRDNCIDWIHHLLSMPQSNDEQLSFVIAQLARKTEHRELNLPLDVTNKILKHFDNSKQANRLQKLLLQENHLTQSEKDKIFGEHLPSGLMLEKTTNTL